MFGSLVILRVTLKVHYGFLYFRCLIFKVLRSLCFPQRTFKIILHSSPFVNTFFEKILIFLQLSANCVINTHRFTILQILQQKFLVSDAQKGRYCNAITPLLHCNKQDITVQTLRFLTAKTLLLQKISVFLSLPSMDFCNIACSEANFSSVKRVKKKADF